jgi:hypothetical protein
MLNSPSFISLMVACAVVDMHSYLCRESALADDVGLSGLPGAQPPYPTSISSTHIIFVCLYCVVQSIHRTPFYIVSRCSLASQVPTPSVP